MPGPWIGRRATLVDGNPDANRAARSAAIGPPMPIKEMNGDDEESQTSSVAEALHHDATTDTTITDAEESPADLGEDTVVPDEVDPHMTVFSFLKIVTVISALYMCTNPWFFFYDAEKAEICPYTVLCATSPIEMALLTGSRISAGILFASLTISIFSKCYATRSYLHHSWLGAVLEFEPTHDLHTYFGFITLLSALEHATLHCIRFISAKQSYLIWETDTGRSGVVGVMLLFPIVLPMKLECLRTKMSFQFRKGMHLLFMPLIVALCFHSTVFRYVGAILIVWYILDRTYFTTKQTFLIAHPVFEAVGRGTMVTLDLPTGYTFKAGSYIYVNSPTISRSEWHPFSIIQVPGNAHKAAFFAEAVGDWTQDLFHLGLEQPRLPLWITAAQPSLMEKSIYYDNLVLVCTGAGITPAVSIIARFAKRKNIHLLWMSRDGAMVALFEKQLRQVTSKVHLTGQQTEETKDALHRLLQPVTRNGGMGRAGSIRNLAATLGAHESRSSRNVMFEEPREERKSSHGDHITFDLNVRGGRGMPDATAFSEKSMRRLRNLNSTAKSHRTVLSFGRPDIGSYLRETFSMETETADGIDESKYSRTMDMSTRLDPDQVASKTKLMKADLSVAENIQRQGPGARSRTIVDDGGNETSKGPRASLPLPWLVLYCGANAKVEEAIAKTCDELRVNWQKEYFGAW